MLSIFCAWVQVDARSGHRSRHHSAGGPAVPARVPQVGPHYNPLAHVYCIPVLTCNPLTTPLPPPPPGPPHLACIPIAGFLHEVT